MGRDNFGRLFLGFNDDDTRRNVTFGDQSPALDALPQPAIVGDVRLRVGNNLTSLKWVCTVSGTPGTWVEVVLSGPGAGTLQFESINLVGTQLDAFVTTGYEQGQLAYVGNDTFTGQHSVQDFFVLKYGEALTPDGLTVVNSPTFGVDGAQWVRMQTHNPANQARGFWCLDPLNTSGVAHDENSGWGTTQAAARLNPLRTIEELNRRMVGVVINGEMVFEQYSSFPTARNGQLTNLRAKGDGDSYPIWTGLKTQVFSAVISAYTAENGATNTRTTMTVPGITGNVGRLVMNAAGTKSAWIMKDISADVVALTKPSTASIIPFVVGASTDFTVGETVRVYTLPSLGAWPFPQNILYPYLTWVEWAGANYTGNQMGSSVLGIINVRLDRVNLLNPNGSIKGSLFFGVANFIEGANNLRLTHDGILNGFLNLVGGVAGSGHETLQIQNGTLSITGCTFNAGTVTSGIAAFDCTGAAPGTGLGAVVIQRGGAGGRLQLAPAGRIYGTGNTGYLLVIAVGTQHTVPLLAGCTATTSAAKPILLEGVEYNYADMPIATTNLTGLNNVDA